MCGNHPSNKGGMTSVINQIMGHDWEKEGVSITFIPTYMPGSKGKTIAYFMLAYVKVFMTLLFRRPDVFYTHMSVKGSFARTKALHRLCRLFRVKDIIHLHGSEFEQWYRSVTPEKQLEIRSLVEDCGLFIVLGQKWERFMRSIAPQANIVQLANSVRIPAQTATWHDDPVRFLYMGVLIPRKGVRDLLEAVKMLVESDTIGRIHVDIAGTGSEEAALKQYAEEQGLTSSVSFLGWVAGEEKDAIIRRSNVLVLPSYNEGLPVAILEAMSYGLPVVSTRVGDIADVIIEDENGYLVNPGEVRCLAEKMLRCADASAWNRLSVNARQRIEEKFNIDRFYSELAILWKRVAP